LDLGIDLQRALEIAIFHDIIEAIAWDTDFSLVWTWKVSKEEKNQKEIEAMKKLREVLPIEIWNQIYDLWDEYEKFETKEAKLVKALDKLESIDHFIRNWSEYYDNPDRIAYYLNSSMKFCPEIKPIHQLYKEKLKNEFLNCWLKWEKLYDIV
jgi:putative hydrolase of HD superfamily